MGVASEGCKDKKQEDGTKRRRSKHCIAQGSTSRVFFEAKRSKREDTDTATYITTHAKETPPRHKHQQESRTRQKPREKPHSADKRTKTERRTPPTKKDRISEHKKEQRKDQEREQTERHPRQTLEGEAIAPDPTSCTEKKRRKRSEQLAALPPVYRKNVGLAPL